MKKIICLIVTLLIAGCVVNADAQKRRPSGKKTTKKTAVVSGTPGKGSFTKKGSYNVTDAVIDLYNKTIEDCEGNMCYGTIEISSQRGIQSFAITKTSSPESSVVDVTVKSCDFDIDIPCKITLTSSSITINDTEGGDYFNNLTLKRTK